MSPTHLILAALVLAAAAAGYVVWRNERRRMHSLLGQRQDARERGALEARLEHPWIDRSRCIGCGSCVRACPEGGVLAVVHGQATIVQGSRCVGHGRCAEECPVGAIALTLGDRSQRNDLPALDADLQAVGRPGLWLAGEVTGYALIRTAVDHGRRAVQAAAERVRAAGALSPEATDAPVDDLIIVGSGPAGLAASLEAHRLGLRFRTLERDTLGGTVARYPRRKLLMTRELELPLGGCIEARGYRKEELMKLWQDLAAEYQLPIEEGVQVESIEPEIGGVTRVRTSSGDFRTRNVVLALGRRGIPRSLGVPGEDRLKVAYSLIDAQAFTHCSLLVVGGGDSAIEAALGLAAQDGNEVHLSYRREAFFRLRSRNELRILEAMREGKVQVHFESELLEINEDSVRLRMADGQESVLANDEVFLMLGGEPPFAMLAQAGVSFDPEAQPEQVQPVEQGPGLRLALVVAALAGAALFLAWWLWRDYYSADLLARRERGEHTWLHSAHGFGLAAGVTAVAMMFANLAYLLRRAPAFPLRWGKLRDWMNVHVATGLLALIFACFHTAFVPRDTPGGRAFWGLIFLVITGAMGRYLYSFVPRAANGRELALEEARQRLQESTQAWSEVHADFGEQARAEIAQLLDRARWRGGFLGSLRGLLRTQSDLHQALRRLRVRGIVADLHPQELEEVLAVARQAHRNALVAAHYGDLRSLLAGWRYFHRWVSLLVVGLVLIHVWAGWRYADLGGRG
jgi:thioredoxin reductase/Pyruvate/2-oxoacid:ferredoxin oxidoreductase delta subunit